MFDIDNYETHERTVIRFMYDHYDDEGKRIARVERVIRNDDAEFLPSILEAFQYFLQGMTFTYVENVVVTTEDGNEISSDPY